MKVLIEVQSRGQGLSKWIDNLETKDNSIHFHQLGVEGVANLKSITPFLTGETAYGWYYDVSRRGRSYILEFKNRSHPETPQPLALMLYYGHGTGTGGWVPGRDYITPAMVNVLSNHRLDYIVKEMTGNG